MATQSGRPPGDGYAAQLQKPRGSRSSTSLQVLVVVLATVAVATLNINDRFHVNTDAEVAPRAQVLRDETIGMGAVAAHPVAFDYSGFTTRSVCAQTELVTRRGHDQRNASSAGSFTASYFSTSSSPICASSLITSKSVIFDQKLITSLSKILQSIANEDIKKIEGERDFRMRRSSRDIHCLPLHIEEAGPLEVLQTSSREILFHGRRLLHEVLPLLHSEPGVLDEGEGHNIEVGGEFRLQRSSCRVIQHLPLLLPLLNSGPRLVERGGHEILHPSAATVVLHLPPLHPEPLEEKGGQIVLLHGFRVRGVPCPLHAELIGEEGTLEVSYTLLHETEGAQSIWCPDQSGGGASAFDGGDDSTSSVLHFMAYPPSSMGGGSMRLFSCRRRPSVVYRFLIR